jgi:hypothetical protein
LRRKSRSGLRYSHPPLEGGSIICFEQSEKQISGRGMADSMRPLPEKCFAFFDPPSRGG